MIPADETFGGTWPFKAHFFKSDVLTQHYVDEGDGDPVICLHGEPTWGYLYRNFIPPLSSSHRVIVPDHMGFGKSDAPQRASYTLKTHVENLAALIEHLDLSNITFVAQDWGGPIAAGYTVRHPERVARLCLMNTITGYGGAREQGLTPWFAWIKHHHDAGTLEEVLGNLGSNILSVMKIIGFVNSAVVDETWIRAYSAPFLERADCIGAIAFPLDVLLGRIKEYVIEGAAGLDHLKSKPAMLAVGLQDRGISPEYQVADFKGVFPGGPIMTLRNAGHFCQEDAPETLVVLIEQFIQMTASS